MIQGEQVGWKHYENRGEHNDNKCATRVQLVKDFFRLVGAIWEPLGALMGVGVGWNRSDPMRFHTNDRERR